MNIEKLSQSKLCRIVEGALLASGEPVSLDRLQSLFSNDDQPPTKDTLRCVLQTLQKTYEERGILLKEVASGYQFQVHEEVVSWIRNLWAEKPIKYSRAFLEVLAIIAYRQPVTRGEIEEVRGVYVNSKMMQTLMEHDWVRIVGHRNVPGKPALYGTTKNFLDHFGLKSLDELPKVEVLIDDRSDQVKLIEEPLKKIMQEELFDSQMGDYEQM
jgi:segregation and condensation protein B